MKSRGFAVIAAIGMALTGAVLIFTYTASANDRAMSGMTPTDVLVVQEAVPAGTPVDDLPNFVLSTTQPQASVAPGALKGLEKHGGKVTAVDLFPGEQLLDVRLVSPGDLKDADFVEVPEGLQEVSFQLEPQRVVGGQIVPGDHVGIFISMEGGGLPDSPGETTQLVLHKTLVTAMQRAPQPITEEGETDDEALPEGSMMVTVAVDDRDAQKIVFAAEFARIWLSKEPLDAKESKPDIAQRDKVYR